jgi:integrase
VQSHKPRTLGRMPVTTFGMAKALAERILRGEEDETPAPEPLTFGDFLTNHYKAYVRNRHSNPADTLGKLGKLNLDEMKLDEIKLAHVETWRLARQEAGIKPGTINRDIATLRAALNRAVEWGLLETHPLARMKQLKVDRKRKPRYLSPDEEKRLKEALVDRDALKHEKRVSANKWRKDRDIATWSDLSTYTDNLTPLVFLAINTGLRRGELWNLVWGDIDLKQKLLTVNGQGAKSGQTRHIPLNDKALGVLKLHRGDVIPMAHVPVFGSADFKKAWSALLVKADIQNFRFHDLRHTFASKLVMAGVPLNTVRELLGHSSIEMTLVYSHLSHGSLQDAVKLI